ncbi:hypothetical protein COV93_02480 [Candidatus Woesearchaeota archaeon CG11_big_fil_rev_8_21_14_0_20_43_8]|nr:MAG: hypothetical protein COV93_02480 [Candidatus Woesearchaeota archaeon CG11_big_fil_rev_8_21_14_0_20_43_8]PIO09009.1 MAG: hypothetical protein COT47_00205 [Candidatus Woesearchaeota archaeon CG08_land_8_20_14_0_20_43_7]
MAIEEKSIFMNDELTIKNIREQFLPNLLYSKTGFNRVCNGMKIDYQDSEILTSEFYGVYREKTGALYSARLIAMQYIDQDTSFEEISIFQKHHPLTPSICFINPELARKEGLKVPEVFSELMLKSKIENQAAQIRYHGDQTGLLGLMHEYIGNSQIRQG